MQVLNLLRLLSPETARPYTFWQVTLDVLSIPALSSDDMFTVFTFSGKADSRLTFLYHCSGPGGDNGWAINTRESAGSPRPEQSLPSSKDPDDIMLPFRYEGELWGNEWAISEGRKAVWFQLIVVLYSVYSHVFQDVNILYRGKKIQFPGSVPIVFPYWGVFVLIERAHLVARGLVTLQDQQGNSVNTYWISVE